MDLYGNLNTQILRFLKSIGNSIDRNNTKYQILYIDKR